MWARWAHKALWHENEAGWSLHKSHHVPRVGPFEANDIYAIANAVPAMGLCLYGCVPICPQLHLPACNACCQHCTCSTWIASAV
jgi:hypothetical protein